MPAAGLKPSRPRPSFETAQELPWQTSLMSTDRSEHYLHCSLLQVHDTACIHEQGTGLAPQARWDLVADRQALQEEQSLQVGQACPGGSTARRKNRSYRHRSGGQQEPVASPAQLFGRQLMMPVLLPQDRWQGAGVWMQAVPCWCKLTACASGVSGMPRVRPASAPTPAAGRAWA